MSGRGCPTRLVCLNDGLCHPANPDAGARDAGLPDSGPLPCTPGTVPIARAGAALAVGIPTGEAYPVAFVIGGTDRCNQTSTEVEEYVFYDAGWAPSPLTSLGIAQAAQFGDAFDLQGANANTNGLYFFGGTISRSSTSSFQLEVSHYELTGTWGALSQAALGDGGTPLPRIHAGVAFVPDAGAHGNGVAYFIGGQNENVATCASYLQDTWIFDPEALGSQWTQGPQLVTPRGGAGVAFNPADGLIYVGGGEGPVSQSCDPSEGTDSLASTEVLDPYQPGAEWGFGPSLSASDARQNLQLVVGDGGLYAIGGEGKTISAGAPLSTVGFLSGGLDGGWVDVAPLNVGRFNFTGTYDWLHGQLLVFGGTIAPPPDGGAAVTNSMEAYDPVADSWTLSSP